MKNKLAFDITKKFQANSICASCQKVIPFNEDESYWHCVEPLCYECWESTGHCGHPDAVAVNDASIAASSPEERQAIFDKWKMSNHNK